MIRAFTLAALVVLSVPAVVVAEDAIPTAPVTNSPEDIDLAKATPEQVKAWLKKDNQGRYLESQISKIRFGPWAKADLVKIFGQPSLDGHLPLWMRTASNRGVIVVVDVALENGLPLKSTYFLTTAESPWEGKLQLSFSPPRDDK